MYGHFSYIVTVFLMVAGLFIIIARGNLIKKLVGLSIFQTSVYMLYIVPGKLIGGTAPIISPDYSVYSNPLPHVLMLTAIVVGVATLALGLALAVRIREAYGAVPIAIGGVEASLRRFAHYDYWDDRVRNSILVDSGANVIVRMPLIRGYNDSFDAITGAIDYVQKLAKRGNIRRIDMLPYHQLGRKKYERLDMPYPITQDPSYSPDELDRLEAFFRQFDFDIRLVRH